MRFLLAGSSGFIGNYLTDFLRADGHAVRRLVRREPDSPDEIGWSPENGVLDPYLFADTDVVINMGGASIAGKRWSERYKEQLVNSRVGPTRLLAETLAQLRNPPAVLISFSAVGYYGYHDFDAPVDESAEPQTTFLSELTQRWEGAAQPVTEAGIELIQPRMGVVIGAGGMLGKLLPSFRLGLGAKLGDGTQSFGWIALDDVGPALLHCIAARVEGPVNFTAPEAVTNAQFTRELAAALHRPAPFSVPPFALRMLVGEVAEELLNGVNAAPRRLLESGYCFRFPTLAAALTHYVR